MATHAARFVKFRGSGDPELRVIRHVPDLMSLDPDFKKVSHKEALMDRMRERSSFVSRYSRRACQNKAWLAAQDGAETSSADVWRRKVEL